ncbi:heme-binding beta-barrel domain-containing protein [Parahaliea mediterranea]|uniref:heme-binding beta-barrel domain-containing protein n=1 Tax=Parahaliea mediterranea TaxID=651086 RepID=UPI0019D4E549|nr:heme-binding beta-barrel domain-containing protein [Parahaliea mediterranea]
MSELTTNDGVDYGPLVALLGEWRGDKGVDRAPEPDGEERNPYYETITFEAAGDVTNCEDQVLAIVRYHQVVRRKSNDKVFHDQVGFWLWEPATNTVMETFTIPRAVAVVATGTVTAPEGADGEVVFEVSCAAEGSGIAQSAYMFDNGRTTAFSHRLSVKGDQMRYTESTTLDIYEKRSYDHKDVNTLTRVG